MWFKYASIFVNKKDNIIAVILLFLRARFSILFKGGEGRLPICVESYFLFNFTMNAVTIAIIARSLGRILWRNVVFAAAFGALYAVAMRVQAFSLLRHVPLKGVLACAIALIAFRVDGPRALLRGVALLVAGTALVGGSMYLTVGITMSRAWWSMALGALAGWGILYAALEMRAQRINDYAARLILRRCGKTARINALIDTGNRLREPLSGLPVLVVEEARIARLLPETFDAARPDQTLPPGFRLVAYGAIGGNGHMACFIPDEVLVCNGDGWILAPDVWVAVYHGTLPCGEGALAPPILGGVQGYKIKLENNMKERRV